MNYEEVLKIHEEYNSSCDSCGESGTEQCDKCAEAHKLITVAIEKQIAKKAAHDEENVFTWLWRCPRCDCRPMQNYCASCGQAIDWSDDEET